MVTVRTYSGAAFVNVSFVRRSAPVEATGSPRWVTTSVDKNTERGTDSQSVAQGGMCGGVDHPFNTQ